MSEGDHNSELKRRMAGAIEVFTKELTGLRTGRASTSLLEPVKVEAYGGQMALTQVATVSVPEARLLTVQVWDKGLVKPVEKAIREANLGLNPVAEGQVIRVPIPPLTEERRKDLIKVAHKYAEQARVSVRNVRRDGMDELKAGEKKGTITEDEHRKRNTQVQTLTDEYTKKIDELLAAKEKDIMHV